MSDGIYTSVIVLGNGWESEYALSEDQWRELDQLVHGSLETPVSPGTKIAISNIREGIRSAKA